MCRKKKIKCDGKLPACSHCVNYKNECRLHPSREEEEPSKRVSKKFLTLSEMLLVAPWDCFTHSHFAQRQVY